MLKLLIALLLMGLNISPVQKIRQYAKSELFTKLQTEIQEPSEPEQIPTTNSFVSENQMLNTKDQSLNHELPPNQSSPSDKIQAYNNASEKVIEKVSEKAVANSPVLESCQTNPQLCQPQPTPSPIPLLTPKPEPTISLPLPIITPAPSPEPLPTTIPIPTIYPWPEPIPNPNPICPPPIPKGFVSSDYIICIE